MSQQTSIGTAREADIPTLVHLLRDLFTIEQDFAADPSRQERGLRLLLAYPDRAVILVARDGSEQPIGMVTGQLVFSTAEGATSMWVEDLIVVAPYRGNGLGRSLLEAALQWARARGASRAQLLVDLDNNPAVEFYSHLGWQATRLGARRQPLR